MIELLGQPVVNTSVKAGLDKFYSIFMRRVSTSGYSSQSSAPRAYSKTRGILIRKEALEAIPSPTLYEAGYYFQFNPERVNDTKGTEYSVVHHPGLNYNDYMWAHGGERIITFQLFLDDTPASHTEAFNPTAYGSKLADKPDEYGKVFGETPWIQRGAYSRTRISERGVMGDVEKITQFLYPAYQGETRPKFAEGGVIDDTQFRPPSTAVLVLGPRYFEGIVKSAPVEYTLFDTDLTPIRATINLEFAAYEFVEVRSLYEKKLTQL